jgi:hypothetical protein
MCRMTYTARETFDLTMQPGHAELDGGANRFEMSKTFHGDFQGTDWHHVVGRGSPGR